MHTSGVLRFHLVSIVYSCHRSLCLLDLTITVPLLVVPLPVQFSRCQYNPNAILSLSLFLQVSLKLQGRLAASILKCGRSRIWLDPNETSDIGMANSRMLSAQELLLLCFM